MDFFDEDDATGTHSSEPPPRDSSTPTRTYGRPSPSPDQAYMIRRLIALGAGIVILILLILAVRGCLDNRNKRSYENYVSDLNGIVSDSQDLSGDFFAELGAGGEAGDTSLSQNILGLRSVAQALADRAAGLDAPDDLAQAQNELSLAYALRRDALAAIGGALDSNNANAAAKQVYEQIKVLSASDVLFGRARILIEQALLEQEVVVENGVPEDPFIPAGNSDPNFLDPAEIAGLLGGSISVGGGGGGDDNDDGLLHGTELVSTTFGGITLDAAVPATSVPAGDDIEISVANGGATAESGIDVTVTADGEEIGNQLIESIEIEETQVVTITPQPTPETGVPITIEVDVAAVGAEENLENNTASYTVTFE